MTFKNIMDMSIDSDLDVLIQKITSQFPNDDHLLYKPIGSFKKGYSKNIDRKIVKRNTITFELNREGIYDILPKRIFHNINDQAILFNKRDFDTFFNKIRKEELEARKFLLPFDSEIISSDCEIERERRKYESVYFSDNIAIEYLLFYNLIDQIGYLSILELLYENLVNIDIKPILKKEISYFDFISEISHFISSPCTLIRFIETLPFASDCAGDTNKMTALLSYILNEEVTSSIESKNISFKNCNQGHFPMQCLGSYTLNEELVLGNSFDVHEKMLVVTITLTDDNKTPLFLQNGCYGQLVSFFFSYFLPLGVNHKVIISSKTNSELSLSSVTDSALQSKYRNKILEGIKKHLGNGSKTFDALIPAHIKASLKKYFSISGVRTTKVKGIFI